jgi:hypothetical protein
MNDLSANFLLSHGKIGDNCADIAAKHIRELNPNVRVHVDTTNVLQESIEFFQQFDVVCCTRYELKDWSHINNICRQASEKISKSISFFATSARGLYGYFFEDLNSHNYVVTSTVKEVGSEKEVLQTCNTKYISLQDTLNVSWAKALTAFGRRAGAATAPLWLAFVILSKWNENHSLPLLSNEDMLQKELLAFRDQQCTEHSISRSSISDELIIELARTWNAEISSVPSLVVCVLLKY